MESVLPTAASQPSADTLVAMQMPANISVQDH
jgi:hypothetical protein